MMVGALYQSMKVKFLDAKGFLITQPPPRLTAQYSQEGVVSVDVSSNDGVFAVRGNGLGAAIVTLLDPDTNVSKQILGSGPTGEFEVLQGRFDPSSITVDLGKEAIHRT